MKTLDEVINALEICGRDESPKCPYFDTEHWCCCEDHMRSISPLKNDALQWLKEYRSDKLEWEAQKKGYEDWIETYKDARDKHQQAVIELKKNPALTWEELMTMEGKPVWVEVDGKERWRIVREVTNEHLILESGLPLHKCWMNHPDGWQAYRKERL